MKKYKIYWTDFASKSLEQIRKYIEHESKSSNLANKYILKLINRVDQLEFFPESGTTEPLLKHLQQNNRYLIEGNYKIIYQFNQDRIIITDVFQVKQNPIKLVKRNRGK